MARQILIVRHARVSPEYVGRYVGRTDPPLGPDADQQIGRLADWLASKKPERCFCSPLQRARQTADGLAGLLGLTVTIDDDLREVDLGDWEGRTFGEIAADYPDQVNRWAQFADDFAFPGGESLAGFLSRVSQVAIRLADNPADVVLAVTHGGVIRAMICHYLGLQSRSYVLFNVRTASCVTIDLFGARGVLSGLNEPMGAEEV